MDASRFVRVTAAALCAAAILLPASALAQRNLSVIPAVGTPNEQRVALVIGNAAYDSDAQLKNPVNDATDIGAALKALQFQVSLVSNADRPQMRRSIRDFALALKRGGIGLFYFAGHGIESKGKNYLIPIGADIKEEFDLDDQAIDVNTVLGGMGEAGNRINIVILDACRNNPFARAWRSASQGGLGSMDAPNGTFIAFATAPRSVAADGAGRNGIFTKHLLANMRQGESDIDRMFTRVAKAVSSETHGRQIPWKSSSLTDIFRFRHDEPTGGAAAQIDPVEQAQWDVVKASSSLRDFDAFLLAYPNGHYASQARDYKTKLLQDLEADQERRRKLEEAQREQQALIEAQRRRLREEEYRLQRQRELDRLKAERDKKDKGVYVAPTF